MQNLKKYFFICLVFIYVGYSCSKNSKNTSNAPSGYVDAQLNITLPTYNTLANPTGFVYIPGGVRGVIVYRKSPTEFMAYERNCTYQSSNACATVSVDATHFFGIDSCCGSKFLLSDGTVNKGPATVPLTRYQVTFDGTTVHVFN